MPAYMIVTAQITDREPFISGYGAQAAVLAEKFGGKYLIRTPGALLLESGLGDVGENASIVITEWADKEAALTFWNSPEYTEVKKLREGVANCQILLIEAPSIGG